MWPLSMMYWTSLYRTPPRSWTPQVISGGQHVRSVVNMRTLQAISGGCCWSSYGRHRRAVRILLQCFLVIIVPNDTQLNAILGRSLTLTYKTPQTALWGHRVISWCEWTLDANVYSSTNHASKVQLLKLHLLFSLTPQWFLQTKGNCFRKWTKISVSVVRISKCTNVQIFHHAN